MLLKGADCDLFLLNPTVEVPEAGDALLCTLQAHGFPTIVSAIPPNPSTCSHVQKSPTAKSKSLLSCNMSTLFRGGYMTCPRLQTP